MIKSFTRSRFALAAGAAAALFAPAALLHAAAAPQTETEPPQVSRHVAVAKAAAGTQWEGLFNTLCAEPAAAATAAAASSTPASSTPASAPSTSKPAPATPPASAPAKPSEPPDRAQWYAAPVKAFDNLYYVGMTEYSAWAVTTSAGIILIDTIFDYSVEAEVVDGLRQLGLDPKTIKYAVISHGHGDHSGGAKYLQDTFGTKIVMSAADWDLVARGKGTKPRRDVVAKDGMALTLGDTTLHLYVTPGHTLGTISAVIPLKDHGQPHVAVTWGGTAFNWLKNREDYITPERPDSFWFRHYSESASRFSEIAAKAHADVLLSNHTVFDGSKTNLPLLGKRTAEQPNPYVVGPARVQAYLTVAKECAEAGLARGSHH